MRAKPLYEFHPCLSTSSPPPPPPPPPVLPGNSFKVFREPGGKSWSDLWLIGVDSQFYLGLIFSVFNLFFFECLIVNVITIGYCFIYLLLFNPIDGVIPLIACAQFVLLINYAWFETRMTVKIRSETWSFAWVLLIKGSRVS